MLQCQRLCVFSFPQNHLMCLTVFCQECGTNILTACLSNLQSSMHLAQDGDGMMTLPRGELLLIGGDLAYPNPSQENYEERLFRPFQDALPPPAHYHPGRLVVHKPDLPPGTCKSCISHSQTGQSTRLARSQETDLKNCFPFSVSRPCPSKRRPKQSDFSCFGAAVSHYIKP